MNVVDLTKALIACPSVTPVTAGVYDVLEAYLRPLGFAAERQTFSGDGGEPVENLYLRYGTGAPNFCFAGHTDVVPPGDESAWSVPPFAPQIRDGMLIGRGAEDMKGAIAAFCVAAKRFIAEMEGSTRSRTGEPERSERGGAGSGGGTPPGA
ncbi:MAG: M20/M25/M40 family metallo-hydrolase [Alphaproteobacteria bacterium]